MTNDSAPTKPLRGMALLRTLRAGQANAAKPRSLQAILAAQRVEAAEADAEIAEMAS